MPLLVGVPVLVGLAIGGHLVRAGAGADDPAASAVAGPGPGTRTPSGPVEAGTYRIRVVGSGLCLGESTTQDGGGAVGQYACPGSVPVYLLEPAGGDQYTIRSLHPVLGHGCLGVDAGLRTDGARLMNDYCGRRGTAERFSVRAAAGGGGRTYRILPVHTGACVSVPGGNRAPGAAAVQLPCAPERSGQLFAFDPVPAPTAVPDIRSN
ncbi:RICIN domain-containing protein [Streptomyces griseus]|uniref:RICIN domain-containing protein n=1 Tax=Streptomyces griseus TaxID=1911 RepID=UPI0004C898F6|nr:RICIN domain-containing protein [Streptomyces griseus]